MSDDNPPDKESARRDKAEGKAARQARKAAKGKRGRPEEEEEVRPKVEYLPPDRSDILTVVGVTVIALVVGAAYWLSNGAPAPW